MGLALVTGGGGFLGGAIARRLLAGGWGVRSYARGAYPQLASLGVEVVRGDIADEAALGAAARGCDAVFHVAAKVGLWGTYEEYYAANVAGTRSVLRACRSHGVSRLVFTGSPSVVFDGSDVDGWDESASYPLEFDSHYSRTKAVSEEMVLSANGPDLATISLRPHLIWGPGENHIVSRIVARGRAGTLRRIGSLNKLVDTTYIDDAAEAHWLALERLEPGAPISGKAYFISQGDPRPIWEIVDAILRAAGAPPVSKRVSPQAAYTAAFILEGVHRLFRFAGEPRLTRFLVSQLATAHWFDIGAARRDLGYAPKTTIEEGLKRLERYFSEAPL